MDSEVIKIDFMCKRSQMKSRITNESYKSRWFRLTTTSLYYCDGKIDTGVGKVKGQIDLSKVKAVEEVEGEALGNKTNVFQIAYQAPDKYNTIYVLYIIAAHAKQREEWIAALRRAADNCRARFSSSYHPGIWLHRLGKYSCCDCMNRKKDGCVQTSFKGTILKNDDSKKQVPKRHSYQRKLVLALYDFKASSKAELSLKKGEEYELISEDLLEDWVQAKDEAGKSGYIPSAYVRAMDIDNMEHYEWYFKDITRMQAEEMLEKNAQEGCFLIRDSSKNGMYTLSIYYNSEKHNGEVKHYHIHCSTDSKFYLSERHKFSSIPELIFYHKHNCAGLVTRLRLPPCEEIKPTISLANTLRINPKELVMKEKLGAGQFGTVTKAIYKGSKEVAVKTIKEGSMSEGQFLEEAEIMAKLHHPNLVQLCGVSTTNPIMILTEYMKHGSLYSFSRKMKHSLLKKTDKLIDICFQICKAMEYLEEHNVIHRDLAARNCLVGENNVVKVSDFGLARFVLDDEYTCSFGSKFPARWASIEVLNEQLFSSKSDVWAFGVLMWEVFTCCDLPYDGIDNKDIYHHVVENGKRLSKPEKCPDALYTIMQFTWQQEPNDRPNFSAIMESLREIIEKEYGY